MSGPHPSPTPMQALILWALVARGGERRAASAKPKKGAPATDVERVSPEINKGDREALVALGLIEVCKAESRRSAMRVRLTDRGWAWAGTSTNVQFPTGATSGTSVLGDILACLGRYLATAGVPLAEFISPAPAAAPVPQRPVSSEPADVRTAPSGHDLAARIRAAYLAETAAW